MDVLDSKAKEGRARARCSANELLMVKSDFPKSKASVRHDLLQYDFRESMDG